MAKNVLPVDFQDDILAESMNGRRKYQMITNSDGTVSFVDVTEYTQVGSNFGQAQVNATNEAVNESADKNKIIDDKDDLVANSQAGMMAGALAVKAIREELTQNMLRISVFNMTLKYSSANVLMASVDHNLGVTPRACIAQISSSDGSLRAFGYALSAEATSSRIIGYAYSASNWNSGDTVDVKVTAFYYNP